MAATAAMASGLFTSCKSVRNFPPCSKTGVFRVSNSLARFLDVRGGTRLVCVTLHIPKATSPNAVQDGSTRDTDLVPTPKVVIDQDSDPDSTIVEITFGDRLGALLDTESSGKLALGAAFGAEPPKQMVDVDIATHIDIFDDRPERSLLVVETVDRPGLLVDLVKIITDINITVQSGEFDTEGLIAKAKFHVSYRDKAISKPLQLVLANSLRYYLKRPITEEASF
ncbi:hypothetical protein AXF42_Ash015732 [Apostasia shenzhenica]|uniref:ACT domain-containing protein ACR n=1 Tax=Apostasia shenzhenica TaxID=1088818 RepID=A0A2H9ZU77_9ASPA|nr:hypothetical protein AXF42_Ash015732 [Apostasia shenzhenica]